MNISIFGLGYVGCVNMGCLAQSGHEVIGVETNIQKVELINQGKPTIIEKDIDEIIAESYNKGKISATTDHFKAVIDSDISLICVGTPSSDNGHLNLEQVFKVTKQIAKAIRHKAQFHVVAIRSTVLPGTNKRVGKIIERISNKKLDENFAVVSNPEFLREGSAVSDFYNPAFTVIGSSNEKAIQIMKNLYKSVKAPIEITDVEVTETIKYVNNSYHALKISFANEVGNICKKLNIDSHKVMNLFCKDLHLNISSVYFKPGFAYGGSCLPKDLKALITLAHDNYLYTPVLESIERSNEIQKKIAINIIESKKKKKVGLVGLSFKEGTDDLRYSPIVEITEFLLGKGYKILIYDENVTLSKLTGTNKEYIEKHVPHLSELISGDLENVIANSELLVITHKIEGIKKYLKKYPEKYIIDLVRINDNGIENYEGICW